VLAFQVIEPFPAKWFDLHAIDGNDICASFIRSKAGERCRTNDVGNLSAIMMTAALMCAPTMSGMTDASTTRSPSTPRTRKLGVKHRRPHPFPSCRCPAGGIQLVPYGEYRRRFLVALHVRARADLQPTERIEGPCRRHHVLGGSPRANEKDRGRGRKLYRMRGRQTGRRTAATLRHASGCSRQGLMRSILVGAA